MYYSDQLYKFRASLRERKKENWNSSFHWFFNSLFILFSFFMIQATKTEVEKEGTKKSQKKRRRTKDARRQWRYCTFLLSVHLIRARVRVRERGKCKETLTFQLENRSIKSAQRTIPNEVLFSVGRKFKFLGPIDCCVH